MYNLFEKLNSIMMMVLITLAVAGVYEKAIAGNIQAIEKAYYEDYSTRGDSINQNIKLYGQPISDKPVLTIEELQKDSNKYLGKTVKIEGIIKDVCQKMGCWFYVDDGTGTIYVNLGMRGYFIPDDGTGPIYVDLSMEKYATIPRDSAKSHVIVEGIVKEEYGRISIQGQGVEIIK